MESFHPVKLFHYHLLKPKTQVVQDINIDSSNHTIIKKYLSDLEDQIKRSMIYPALRDSDTTDEEAEDYIREELISIMPSLKRRIPIFITDILMMMILEIRLLII